MNMLFRRPVPPWRAIGAPVFLALLAFATVAIAQAPPATAPATRPKIGLVLSGGGARGLTHIGVLEVMEEMRIPVDYIAATSMGSIVGGLYSSGRTPADMHTIVTTLNWNTLFSDSPPRRELDFRDKQIDTRFPLPLEIGFRDGEVRGFQGALSGANLELFLHELTASADGIRDLDKLPIPFRAVATDMVAGVPYVFTEGPLYEAMRASMSVPGIFSPVEVRGRILGDGGLVDNVPIDVVRQMGADVVIAVNIGTPLAPREALSSIIGLTGQMINILTEQNVRIQLASLREGDVLISPNLGALTSSEFDKSREFIELGVAAAREAAPKLAAFSLSPEAYAAYKAARPTHRRHATAQDRLRPGRGHHLRESEGGRPRPRCGDRRAARCEGAGRCHLASLRNERVRTHRLPRRRGKRAHGARRSTCARSRSGRTIVRFGLNYATDFQGESTFSLLAGLRRVWINSLGAQWTNELEVGRIARAATEFYQPLDLADTVFVAAYASVQSVPRYIFDGSQRVAEYRVQANTAGFDVGVPFGNTGEIRVGPSYTFYKGSPTVAIPGFLTARETDAGLRALARWDNLDNSFFPHRGLRATLDAFYGQRTQRAGDDPDEVSKKLGRIDFYGNAGIPVTPDDFFNVALRAGALSRDDPALVNPFLLGGFLNLSGLRNGQLAGSYLGFGRIVYYHRITQIPLLGGNVYLGGSVEAGNAWQLRDSVSAGDLLKAGSVFVGADTFLGPFYFAYGRASGNASSFYLFLGRP